MRIAQLSDTHLLADGAADLRGHNPARNLVSVLDVLPDELDVVLLTGDVADAGEPDAYRLAQSLTVGLAPYRFWVPGNHDDPDAIRAVLGPIDDVRVVPVSRYWSIALLNTCWPGHDAGRVDPDALALLRDELARTTTHVLLCVHHPPISPCPNPDCGLVDGDQLVRAVIDSPVRAVVSGHVHCQFATTRDGVQFLGAPSTFRQLRHGGTPHYQDAGKPPAAQVLAMSDDGTVTARIVTAAVPATRYGAPRPA